MATTVEVFAGIASSGRPVKESLKVQALPSGELVVLASPGLVLGVAAGDRIRIDSQGKAEVVFRGGNLCVWFFGEEDELLAIDRRIDPSLRRLGAHVDGADRQLRVLTVPLRGDFERIEQEMSELLDGTRVKWHFGNVYDPTDGVTPLDWWLQDNA